MTIVSLSAEAALSQLLEAFPGFTEHTSADGRGEQFRLDLKAGNVSLICILNDFGWSLRIMNRGIVQPNSAHDPAEVDLLVCQKNTLEDAIAALRQANAVHLRALGLVGGGRTEASKKMGRGGLGQVNQHEIRLSTLALKDQDKRTRHAIADAVAQHLLELGMELPGIDAVIMNCRGGLTNGNG
jgi:hypothetical protein